MSSVSVKRKLKIETNVTVSEVYCVSLIKFYVIILSPEIARESVLTPKSSLLPGCSYDQAFELTMHVSRTRTIYGSRAFSVAAPTLWNSLPADITNTASLTAFRNRLKTFLFHHTPSGCSAD